MGNGDNGPKYQHAINHVVMDTGIDTDIVIVPRPSTEELLVLGQDLMSSQNATFISAQVSWDLLLRVFQFRLKRIQF